MKKCYRNPFAQFILVQNAEHVTHQAEAKYSWNLLKHFYRSRQGQIRER
ncbi:Protein of unknown function [Lactobacillus equicursoris DSM 19284 = JCM 14600 = CIP 110162]|nr:Protein of unknown function [Lactobacillus equicursoris DSM 19284 = JCM 14600 = CIP 110162]